VSVLRLAVDGHARHDQRHADDLLERRHLGEHHDADHRCGRGQLARSQSNQGTRQLVGQRINGRVAVCGRCRYAFLLLPHEVRSRRPTVTVTGTIDGRAVCAEVHGPHDVRGDSLLVTVAAGLIRRGVTVHAGAVLGGGPAGFDDDRIAPRPFEVLDEASGRYQGIEPDARRGWCSELGGGRAQAER
jgi:hypothetical protein